MFTRKQYLDNECTVNEYYNQFITYRTLALLVRHFGKEKLKKWDPKVIPNHIIPLAHWDACPIACNY